ncbi:MAG: glycosyltransferase family A protein, partial [Candidatus Promineifilaceae bacterium]
MKSRRFSILIPTAGRPSALSQCLLAVARLDYPVRDVEVVVVADGRQPDLYRLLEPLRGRLELALSSQSRAGPAAARNRAAQLARGELLAFLDDDCLPAADWLSALEARLAAAEGWAVGGQTVNGLADNPYA